MIHWKNTQSTLFKHKDEGGAAKAFDGMINKTYELGFQYCSFKMSSNKEHSPPIEYSNYSAEWRRTYFLAQFSLVDPVMKYCKENVLPLVWQKKHSRTYQAFGNWRKPWVCTTQ